MKKKIKISAVSYLNTLPFLYGLRNYGNISEQIDIQRDIPSVCANKLINNEVDIGLIPIAEIHKLSNPYVISNYCIGAVGKVKTVLLLSNVPVAEIKNIFLDYHSRTSVNLLKILAKNHWKININYIDAKKGFEEEIKNNTAGLIIGDRAFKYAKNFKYVYDLSEEWLNFAKLPFVFAAWVTNKKLEDTFVTKFNEALKFGLLNINQVVANYKLKNQNSDIDIKSYLEKSISYHLDVEKRRGMDLFLKMLKKENKH
ncbi:MAG: menaquinone biosynthesis protein [Bacteroidales bacterium]|nr:menaquinone biosynthesis protein [Bacteroidales bacterium]